MVTLTAILKCAIADAEAVQAALLQVVEQVRANEPGTLGYFVARSNEDAIAVFTTYERFADETAMETHNGSPAVAQFFETAGPLLTEPATIVMAQEIAVKPSNETHSNIA